MRTQSLILTLLPPSGGSALVATADLARAAGVSRNRVAAAVDRLVKRGLATKARLGHYRRTTAGDAVVAAGATIRRGSKRPGIDAAPCRAALRRPDDAGRNALRDRAWAALRMLKKATIPELLELAARGDEAGGRSRLSEFLSVLARHGVVARLKRRVAGVTPSSPGFVQWALIRDLGPKAPLLRRDGTVFDRNQDAVLTAGE